jgi:hypothetical protein
MSAAGGKTTSGTWCCCLLPAPRNRRTGGGWTARHLMMHSETGARDKEARRDDSVLQGQGRPRNVPLHLRYLYRQTREHRPLSHSRTRVQRLVVCPYGSPCRCRCPRCHDSGTIWGGGCLVRCPSEALAVMKRDDYQAEQARDCHAEARALDRRARAYRRIRNTLVRQLRASDPVRWTMSALATEVGCSKELIAFILRPVPAGTRDGAASPTPGQPPR